MKIRIIIIISFLFISTFFVFESHYLASTFKPLKKNKTSNLILSNAKLDDSETYLSPIDLEYIESSNILIIAQNTGNRIDFFDTRNKKIINTIKLHHKPSGICLSHNKKMLFVTAGVAEGKLYLIDISANK